MPRARERESEGRVWGGQPAGAEARASAVGRWRGRPRRGRRRDAFLSEEDSKKFFQDPKHILSLCSNLCMRSNSISNAQELVHLQPRPQTRAFLKCRALWPSISRGGGSELSDD